MLFPPSFAPDSEAQLWYSSSGPGPLRVVHSRKSRSLPRHPATVPHRTTEEVAQILNHVNSIAVLSLSPRSKNEDRNPEDTKSRTRSGGSREPPTQLLQKSESNIITAHHLTSAHVTLADPSQPIHKSPLSLI